MTSLTPKDCRMCVYVYVRLLISVYEYMYVCLFAYKPMCVCNVQGKQIDVPILYRCLECTTAVTRAWCRPSTRHHTPTAPTTPKPTPFLPCPVLFPADTPCPYTRSSCPLPDPSSTPRAPPHHLKLLQPSSARDSLWLRTRNESPSPSTRALKTTRPALPCSRWPTTLCDGTRMLVTRM